MTHPDADTETDASEADDGTTDASDVDTDAGTGTADADPDGILADGGSDHGADGEADHESDGGSDHEAASEADHEAASEADHEGASEADRETDDGETTVTLVTALEESSGKTAVAIALARAARERGEDVAYMKPKGTRLESNVGKTLDTDPLLARDVLGLDTEIGDMEPVVYSSTFVEEAVRAREQTEEVRDRVREAFERVAAGSDRVVVEGGGVVSTGGIVGLTDADVADLLDARVVLVAGYDQAADLDPVLWTAEAFRDGTDRLGGVLFNGVPDSAVDGLQADAIPFLEGRDVPVHGVVPHQRDLAGVTVAELAEDIGAEVLAGEAGDGAYVERFAVGAMSAEAALRYFRRSTDLAVITGGDRAEIHTAALEAPGVRCLILTGGHRPSGAVLGTAEEKSIPVLVVNTDTLSTVERAEAVVRGGRTRDRETVERMGELLAEHADVDALLRKSKKDG